MHGFAIDKGIIRESYMIVADEKPAGTNGGSVTTGSWLTRDLNTVRFNNIPGASLGSNQITLPAGTYIIEAICPASDCGTHKAKLYNITDATDAIIGDQEWVGYAGAHSSVGGHSLITGQLTITSPKVFEIQHQVGYSVGGTFGTAANWVANEVYTQVKITKTNEAALSTYSFGRAIQIVNYTSGAAFTSTTTIPLDNTIPQNTEGAQWATLNITPTSAANILVVHVVLQATSYLNNGGNVIAALFKNGSADALASAIRNHANEGSGLGTNGTLVMNHYMVAGTASPMTFSVRVGPGSGAYTVGINTNSAWTAVFGGSLKSSITITEYAT